MRTVDEQIMQDEMWSIVNYILEELDFQVNGSYLIESVPTLEIGIYERLIRKLRSRIAKTNQAIGEYSNEDTEE